MSLQSHHLEAFLMIARTQNFSKAAQILKVTQSALSHRISALEDQLGAPLFVREKVGIKLTELGDRLLRYTQTKNALEEEFLSTINDVHRTSLKGVLRVGAYASIGRSVVLKALGPFLAQNPGIQLFYMVRELTDLPQMLKSGEVDFIFLDYNMGHGKLKSTFLGEEEYALVESKHGCNNQDIYLNHDEADLMTFKFYEIQKKKPKNFKRSYFDEIYSCIDGVAHGVGLGVLPIHLLKGDARIHIHTEYKNLKMPVYLHYFEQKVYTELQQQVIKLFETEVPKTLQLIK